jgi:hypothetical protein
MANDENSDLEERRKKVIGEICVEDVERRRMCAEELKSRLVDFWIYLDAISQAGQLGSEPKEQIADEYIAEMIEHEGNDPIGRLCYINPGVRYE